MGKIGALGDVRFETSSNLVRTVGKMSGQSSARWHVHERHLLPPILEFGGVSTEKISLTVTFAEVLGVDPAAEIEKLLAAQREGTVMRLTLGAVNYGKWVMESLSVDARYFDGAGNVIAADVTLNLLKYNDR